MLLSKGGHPPELSKKVNEGIMFMISLIHCIHKELTAKVFVISLSLLVASFSKVVPSYKD